MQKKTEREKRTVVLCGGVFDILHVGHLKFLENAKKLGGKNAKLVVVITCDENVRSLKGKEPIFSEDHRKEIIQSLKVVDQAILGYTPRHFEKIIEMVRPDIIAVGYDQLETVEKPVRETILKKGWKIKIVRVKKYGLGLQSSRFLKNIFNRK
jgi:FAD synthetase